MDMRKLVGRNFARLRLAKGFTQERFAELSGFTQQYVSGLERGRRNPTVVTLYHLAQALGVSHVELVMPDDEALRETAKPPKRKLRKSREPRVRHDRAAVLCKPGQFRRVDGDEHSRRHVRRDEALSLRRARARARHDL